ncbi:MAG: HAD hydrolase-like protein [Thermodesulfobacteriota bacterium]|nr:HAD hydrolase-like protein [Thermodesulfobacteriota bacterium]
MKPRVIFFDIGHNGFQKNFPEISSQLDFTVLSYRLQHKKPSLDIYREAGEPPQSCWMVGDSYELDMEPARRVGFKTLWILCRPERERSLVVELLNAEEPLPDGVVEDLEAADRFFMERLDS